MVYKKLILNMTAIDAKKYVDNHKKWRLPTLEEAIDIFKYIYEEKKKTDKNAVYVEEHVWCEDICPDSQYATSTGNNGRTNILFKLPVYLIASLDNVQTGTVFHIAGSENKVITYDNKQINAEPSIQKIVNILGKNDIILISKGEQNE